MRDRQVALYPLTFIDEGDDVLVGRPDIESYAVFPADGAELVRRLHAGAWVNDVVDWYQKTYREAVDIDDLLDTLRDLSFLRETNAPVEAPAPVRLRGFARAVFSPPALFAYAVAVGAAVAVLVRDPSVRPTPSRVFFTRSLVVAQLALVVTEIPLLFLHESCHVLAGRRLNLSSSLSIGRRLYFVVFQTTMTKLFSVPRRKRYLPLLAGMIGDSVTFSILVLAAETDRLLDGSISVGGRLAVAIAYFTAVRFCWQFLFFLETDIHHVLATALGCADLRGMTRAYLRIRLWRIAGRPERAGAETYFSPRDLAVLRWFGPITLVGTVVLMLYAVVTAGPVLAGFATRIGHGMAAGTATAAFWDAVVSLLLFVAQFGLLVVLLVRDRWRRRALANSAARQ
ncbi:MAG TPA: hypothetical protein VFX70_10410 [Mycobacteriales bacterium]|nr:hypothetical protein [Mycobacteriales bacterium]